MGLRETRPHQPLHRRTAADMVLPSNGTFHGHVHIRPLPALVEDPLPNPHLLRD